MNIIEEETASVVNQLFDRLVAINPAFKQAWPTEYEFKATKKEWTLAFIEAGISSIDRVKKGLKNVRMNASPFVPSPGEFISMCVSSPSDIGAPSLDQAYNEACQKSHPCYGENKNWSHEVVRYAASKAGSYFLRTEPISKSKPVFEKYYTEACEDFASGRIMQQLETREPTRTERQECWWYVKNGKPIPDHLIWVFEYYQGEKGA